MNRGIIKIFIFWVALLLVVGIISSHFRLYSQSKCTIKNQLPYYRWDSFWYTSIARHGYSFFTEKNSSIAFFPFYPLTIKAIHYLSNAREDWVSFVSNILYSLLIIIFLYRLSRLDFSENVSRNIVLVWLFFPPAYFLLSGYPEALFILLAILSFYFARKCKWLGAGVAAGLLAVTKPYGIFIMPALFVEYLDYHNWDIKIFLKKISWLPLIIPLLTFGSFVLFNFIEFKNYFAFLDAQNTWGRTLGNPFSSLFIEAKHYLFENPILTGSNFPYVIYLASFIFSIVAFYLSWKYIRKSYLVFSGLLLLSAFLTGTLTSWGRYMFLGFPILMGPAVYLSQKKYLFYAYIAFSASALVIMASFFVRCYPIE